VDGFVNDLVSGTVRGFVALLSDTERVCNLVNGTGGGFVT
jgi:hypothetical protein